MITVFIIDNDVYQQGMISILKQYPEFQVIGTAHRITDKLDEIEDLNPNIIIIDIFSQDGEGCEAIATIKTRCPNAKTLIFTQLQNDEDCLKALKAGAKGYLPKNIKTRELVECISLVATGSALVFGSDAASILDHSGLLNTETTRSANELSTREKEILHLVAQGTSTKEIATKSYVSETTIKAHLRKIMEKLDAKNRPQAVAIAIEKGVFEK